MSRAYARSDMLERRRPIMQAWAAFLAGETETAKVRQSRKSGRRACDEDPIRRKLEDDLGIEFGRVPMTLDELATAFALMQKAMQDPDSERRSVARVTFLHHRSHLRRER